MKEIQEAIEKGKIDKIDYVNYKVIEYPNEFLYCYDKSELLHLLSLVAEKQRLKIAHIACNEGTYDAIMETPLVTNNLEE